MPESSSMVSEERSELSGTVLDGRYHLGCCIGIGGTGVVFEAWRIVDGLPVVVKALRPMYAHQGDLLTRLRREGEVATNVHHPGIVPVYDEGTLEDATPYVVMQRLSSESLANLLRRRGRLGVRETCAIAVRVADILHAVHRTGYVHRDVKPEHILLDRTPGGELSVFLIDFGICASESAPADERERERGRVFGTPSYVSPEQAAGDPEVDGRADVYGLGVTMYECLAGRVPFRAENVTDLLRRIIKEEPLPLSAFTPSSDPDLDRVVQKAVSRFRDQRYLTARAFGRAMRPLVGERLGVERRLASGLRVSGNALPSRLQAVSRVSAA